MGKYTLGKKIIIYVLSALLIFFIVYSAFWFVNYRSYDKYIDDNFNALPYSPTSFVDRTGSILYGVKKPPFLTFTGNLSCISDDNTINFILWPSFMCRSIDEVGLILYDADGSGGYMIYLDENLEYDSEKNTLAHREEELSAKSLLEKRREEIKEIFDLLKIKFNM